MRRVLIAVVCLVPLVIATGAYATGNLPYSVMSEGLETDAWQAKHCGGDKIGRPGLCPSPGPERVDDPPIGTAGRLISIGDSFSSGEGAPSTDQYRKLDRTAILNQWANPFGTCDFVEVAPCIPVGDLEKTAWIGASGFYPGTDEPGGNTCHRSPEAYGPRLAKELNLTLDFRACSGAVADKYFTSQGDASPQGCNERTGNCGFPVGPVPPLPSDTKLVTVGLGGNDAHFVEVVKVCIATGRSLQTLRQAAKLNAYLRPIITALELALDKKWTSNSCAPFVRDLTDKAEDRLLRPTDENTGKKLSGITDVLRNLRGRMPAGSRLIVTSYPHLFPEDNTGSCGAGTGEPIMGPSEQKAINEFVDKINSVVRAAATAQHADFVDMKYAFVGKGVKAGSRDDHGMCQDRGPDNDPTKEGRWMNRFRWNNQFTETLAVNGTAHPNTVGQSVYATHMLTCYRNRLACDNYLESVDWKTPTLAALGCKLPADDPGFKATAWDPATVTPRLLDVTGDGKPEVVVAGECPTTTSSNPAGFAVFDVAGVQPKLLGVLGTEHYYRGPTLTASGKEVVVTGPSVGGKDPLCCATHIGKDVYQWDGSTFRNISSSERAPKEEPEQAAPGPVVDALISSVDLNRRTVTYDVVQWFDGQAAEKECRADGLPLGENEWCHDYYWRNVNDLLRTADVVSVAKLELIDQFGSRGLWKTVDLKELASYAPKSGQVFTLHLSGTKIISIKERFTP